MANRMYTMARVGATVAGLGILASVAHITVSKTGGWGGDNALQIATLAACVGLGAIFGGLALSIRSRGFAAVVFSLVLVAEVFGLGMTAERIVSSREAAAVPLRQAVEARRKAEQRVVAAEAALATTSGGERLRTAETAKAAADRAVLEKASERGCAQNCRALLEAQVTAAAAEVAAARSELAGKAKAAAGELQAARDALEAMPLPPSASPLADRLGISSATLDIAFAVLASLALNGMAAALIAFGTHAHRQDEPVAEAVPMPSASTAVATITEPVVLEAEAVEDDEDDEAVGVWLSAETLPGTGDRLAVGAAYDAFRRWCEVDGRFPMSIVKFGRALDVAGVEKRRISGKVYLLNRRLRPAMLRIA